MVEVENLLAKMEVINHERTPRADANGILVIVNRTALSRCQRRMSVLRRLMQLTALTPRKGLVVDDGMIFWF